MKALILLTAAALAGSVATAALAQDVKAPAGLSVTTGLDYSSGSYGAAEKTKILVAPFSAAYRTDAFRLSATLPYVGIDGPAGVVLGPDGRPLPGVPGVAGKRSGLGDLSLGASATLPPMAGFSLDLTGRVKLPTSKAEEYLGTGETDVTVGADLSYPIGAWGPFVTVGYRMPGDPPGLDLRNTYATSVGTSLVVGKSVLIVSYDYAQASAPQEEPAREVFGAVSTPVTDRANATLYGIAGLSEGSPDFGMGLLLTLKLR